MTKRVKLAIIRKDNGEGCPFGLPIPFSCRCAGNIVDRLAPLDLEGLEDGEDKEKVKEANERVFSAGVVNGGETKECKYAANIIDSHDAVDCTYSDSAPGEGAGDMVVSAPYYNQLFSGIGMNSAMTYPLGYYADYNLGRSIFYGFQTIQGEEEYKRLRKIGNIVLNEAQPANKKK